MLSPLIVSKSSNLHIEAADWRNRVVDNGGSVSNTTLRAVNEFCKSIDRAGLRNRFSRLNLICGNDINSCVVPLYISPGFGATTEGFSVDTNYNFTNSDYSETGSTGGLKSGIIGGGGSNKFLDTGIVVTNSSYISPNDSHMSAYIVDRSYGLDMGMALDFWGCDYGQMLWFSVGSTSANYSVYEYPDWPNTSPISYHEQYFGPSTDPGFFLGSFKIDNTNNNSNVYRDSISDDDGKYYNGTITPSNWTNYTYSLRIFDAYWGEGFGCNEPSSVSYGWISSYSIGKSMSSTQQSDFYNILQTFQTVLGRDK